MKPDHDLVSCVNQGCYDELMEMGPMCWSILRLQRSQHHTNADESDEIETAKLNVLKEWEKDLKREYPTIS